MYVNFKKLVFQNILSYGSCQQEISFDNGLNLVTGKNGSGKSGFLLDALSFCLFGKPYRKIKINELINRKNKKRLYTECVFEANNHSYRIIRTLQPAKLDIFKDGVEIEQLSSKGLTQDEIDKIIGVDYTLFKQIITLSINYNKPFLALYAFDKRAIVESIFNIKIFSDMLKILKKESANLKMQCDIDRKTLAIMENNIKSMRKRMRELSIALKDFEINKQTDISKIQSNIDKRSTELSTLQSLLINLREQIHEIEPLKQHTSILEKAQKNVSVEQYKIKHQKELQQLLLTNTLCPACNSQITDEHREKELYKITTSILQSDKIIDVSKKEITTSQINIDSINKKTADNDKTKSIINETERRIEWVSEELQDLQNQLKSTSERAIDFNLDSLQQELDEKADEYAKLYEVFQKNLDSVQINDVVLCILSDNGIKSHFYKKLMPLLNSKINHYLSKFELPIQIELNELMEEKIVGLDNSSNEMSYFAHSEGEKKRIDMAILLSFISMTKLISNWECNILIFDELLDSAMDDDGLESVVSCLKGIKNENKNLCVYVISHRLIDYDQFNKQIYVEKQGGFSTISFKS